MDLGRNWRSLNPNTMSLLVGSVYVAAVVVGPVGLMILPKHEIKDLHDDIIYKRFEFKLEGGK